MKSTYYVLYNYVLFEIKFKQKVARPYFDEVIQLANVLGKNYNVLFNQDFQNTHLIKSVKEIRADYIDFSVR